MALIDPATRRMLLAIARAALEARVLGERSPAIPPGLAVAGAGVFVSVYCAGQLRGCLGSLDCDDDLTPVIARLAADVAHEDYRFEPLAAHELDRVTLDLSILATPAVVSDLATIVVGRDGLIVEHGRHRGLLLPQVATEHGWDRETLIAQTCVKAGLSADAWQNGATIWRFEAEVFGDDDARAR
jgi:AmmeMemoRadiSam system protein A